MRKSKGRMEGLFLKVEKEENLVVFRTEKLEDSLGWEREIRCLKEGRHGGKSCKRWSCWEERRRYFMGL